MTAAGAGTGQIVVIDYGAGNIGSVAKALAYLGVEAPLVSDPEVVERAGVVVFPGVGAAGEVMARLRTTGLDQALLAFINSGRPYLGICLGLQLLFAHNEEDDTPSLGLFPGSVRKFPVGAKVPHMGWNQVHAALPTPLLRGLPDGSNFYFVHSYRATPENRQLVAGETDYAGRFCSVLQRDNVFATQFHPEKSGGVGLRLLQNFLDYCAGL